MFDANAATILPVAPSTEPTMAILLHPYLSMAEPQNSTANR